MAGETSGGKIGRIFLPARCINITGASRLVRDVPVGTHLPQKVNQRILPLLRLSVSTLWRSGGKLSPVIYTSAGRRGGLVTTLRGCL
jgi:hypothetical protein